MAMEGSAAIGSGAESQFFAADGVNGASVVGVYCDVDWLVRVPGLHDAQMPVPAKTLIPLANAVGNIKQIFGQTQSGNGTVWFGRLKR